MELQWDRLAFLRELIASARVRDMEINEITVSPAIYDELNALAAQQQMCAASEMCLRFYDVIINKRKCKGCCTHGGL